jgi:Pvc16 N-terminal domain
MIQDVDESLRALVRRDALRGSDVEVAFDAPTRDWAARRNAPVVDLYLYDIREDQHRRQVVWERVHDDDGVVLRREPPPRRLRLAYLITAWTQRPEDEHRLLSALLGCFLSHDIIPTDLLTGSFLGTPIPLHLHVAQPPPQDRSLSDVWSALGGELKPSLDLVVIAPFTVQRAEQAAPPVLEIPRLTLAGAAEDGEAPARAGTGGRRRRGEASAGDSTRTASGTAAGDTERTPFETAAESRTYVPGALPGEVAQDVSIRAGGKGRPGRIVRVRGVRRP